MSEFERGRKFAVRVVVFLAIVFFLAGTPWPW